MQEPRSDYSKARHDGNSRQGRSFASINGRQYEPIHTRLGDAQCGERRSLGLVGEAYRMQPVSSPMVIQSIARQIVT